MDSIGHTQKLFARVDEGITAFIAVLSEMARDPGSITALKANAVLELGKMMSAAKEIGGKLYEDIVLLKKDFHQYLIEAETLDKIQQDAMRIKHEVRAL